MLYRLCGRCYLFPTKLPPLSLTHNTHTSSFLEASMASSSSSPSLSVRSGSSISTSSSSSSLSSLYSKGARRPRSLPRRGQIKGAIFASIFASLAQLLGAKTPENAANSQHEEGSPPRLSDFRMDVAGGLSADEGEGFGLSVRSSPVSNCSGSVTPESSFKPLPRPRSFYGGMNGKG